MQKGQASQQILPSTLASMFQWQPGLWKHCLRAKSNSTGYKKVSDPERLIFSEKSLQLLIVLGYLKRQGCFEDIQGLETISV